MRIETIAELAVLAAVAWPFARAVSHRSLRRAFPRTAAALFAALLVYSGGVIWLTLRFPDVLRPLAVVTGGIALLLLWSGRPGRGRAHRQPPGSRWLFPFGYLFDPFFFQRLADRHGPVFKMHQFGVGAGPNPWLGFVRPVVCVLGMNRGLTLLRDHDKRLMPPEVPFSRFVPKRYLRYMEPADHAHYRRLFQSAFTTEVIDESATFMATAVQEFLSELARHCANHGPVQPEVPIKQLSFQVFMRCFYGITPGDERFERLRKAYIAIDIPNDDVDAIEHGLGELQEILLAEGKAVAQARKEGTRTSRSFLGEIATTNLEALDDLSAMRNLIYIALASWIDTAGLMVWLFKRFCDEPEWAARLREATTAGEDGDQAPLSVRFVLEALRLHQSEYIYRRAVEDIDIDDFVVPKDWLVRVCVRENHRDPAVFENPNQFDPDRFLRHTYARTEFSPFGASRISCLGEHLVMTFGRVLVEEMAKGVECTPRGDGPVEFRRWHWKPSSKFVAHVALRDPIETPGATPAATRES